MPGPAARLIYHPRRACRRFDATVVHFDSTTGNQNPYPWNDPFLHSYCHITQFHAEVGDINLWVSGDRFPDFSRLYCDLVFIVAGKYQWADANALARNDPHGLVSSWKLSPYHLGQQAYSGHRGRSGVTVCARRLPASVLASQHTSPMFGRRPSCSHERSIRATASSGGTSQARKPPSVTSPASISPAARTACMSSTDKALIS